ncbi:hypothetical protein ACTHAM_002899 [Cellulomonas soli]|uniref:hypothetical protein n=1 Tax=Cellulomonas soli TaxID=931535 RepID=UPI003F835698
MSSRFTFTISGIIDIDDPERLASSVGRVISMGAGQHNVEHDADAQLALNALLASGLGQVFDRDLIGEYRIKVTTVDARPTSAEM